MSSIIDQLTELYVFVDDFLTTHPSLARAEDSWGVTLLSGPPRFRPEAGMLDGIKLE